MNLNKDMKKIFSPNPLDEFKAVLDKVEGNNIVITLSQMYEHLSVGFKELKKICKYFGTEEITVDQDFYSGCETCDYGSSYEHTFYIKNAKNIPNEEQ